MKKAAQMVAVMERKWLLPLLASSLISIALFLATSLTFDFSGGRISYLDFLVVTTTSSSNAGSGVGVGVGSVHQPGDRLDYGDDQVQAGEGVAIQQLPQLQFPSPPKLAYLISGTKGDGNRMRRVLQALYHPRNQYVLHLDLEAPPRERVELARYVKMEPTFEQVKNVHVIGKANLVTYRGPTMVSCTLHAAAILLRQSPDWDWFINLSASDYPLMTQDDLLHVMSYLPKDLNFVDHTSDIGWKEFQRAKPLVVDPGLYLNKKSDVFWATQRRSLPTAFKLFTGSAWVGLSRAFVNYCIMGWDNLPRTLLMYYTNFISSPEGYFHTVICNSREFRNTTVNHDLHYIAWDNPPKQHPITLTSKLFANMTASGAPFARKFGREDPVLDKIDKQLLGRKPGSFVPGGWCLGPSDKPGDDPCSVIGDPTVLRPGPGAKRLEKLILRVMSPKSFRANQCKVK